MYCARLIVTLHPESVRSMQKTGIKQHLIEQLRKEHAFWSYNPSSVQEVSDDLLVEWVMLYLDIDDINLLFQLLPFNCIKRAWLRNVVSQGERYYQLNVFFAWYYFNVKDPRRYVKSMATRAINKRLVA